MAGYRKLGRTSSQRKALLRNQVTNLLYHGKIVTTEAKAKEIALNKAGLSSDSVIFDKIELDYDDGTWQYEVEFRKDRNEYDADIKAIDGEVLKWDVD